MSSTADCLAQLEAASTAQQGTLNDILAALEFLRNQASAPPPASTAPPAPPPGSPPPGPSHHTTVADNQSQQKFLTLFSGQTFSVESTGNHLYSLFVPLE
ncbi:hypothetical protein VKT23_007836 [Stygiomarasmius scandens]|uniref:Uncharacterized protein n=1 Tax=Marasmiellus scandens TaxID=2682957 RepID=A0ABR1JLU3_9AGAR